MIDQEIARRMANYQKYGQLVDLLALQKLKSDKEAAIRQMQLAQAAQGEMPTVAEQREQEVLDMTKQELAGRVGGIARQQQSAQQSAMQKLLSGIAKAPGAQIAAQPQMMAAGGIVAFQAGGSAGDREAGLSMAERANKRLREKGGLYSGRRFYDDRLYDSRPPEETEEERDFIRALLEQQRIIRAAQEADPDAQRRLRAAREQLQFGPISPMRERMQAGLPVDVGPDVQGAPPPPPREQEPMTPEEAARLRMVAAGSPRGAGLASLPVDRREEEALRDFPQAREFRPPPERRAPPPPAAAAAPAAAPAAVRPLVPAAKDPFRTAIEAGILAGQQDPMEQYRRLEAAYPQANQAEREAAAAAMARRRQMMEEEFDPRREGIEQLLRMGTAFSRGLTPGSGASLAAATGLGYTAERRAARRKAEEDILGMEEKARAEALAGRRAAAEAGVKGFEAGERARTSGTAAGASIISADIAAEASKIATQAKIAENALAQQRLSHDKALVAYQGLSAKRAEIVQKIEAAADKALGTDFRLQNALHNPTDPKNQAIIQSAEERKQNAVRAALSETDAALAVLEKQLGIPPTGSGGAGGMPTLSAVLRELAERRAGGEK